MGHGDEYYDEDDGPPEPACFECGVVPHETWCSEAESTWRVNLYRAWWWHVMHWRTPSLHMIWWRWKSWRIRRAASRAPIINDDDIPF